jgi:hypothetical protein
VETLHTAEPEVNLDGKSSSVTSRAGLWLEYKRQCAIGEGDPVPFVHFKRFASHLVSRGYASTLATISVAFNFELDEDTVEGTALEKKYANLRRRVRNELAHLEPHRAPVIRRADLLELGRTDRVLAVRLIALGLRSDSYEVIQREDVRCRTIRGEELCEVVVRKDKVKRMEGRVVRVRCSCEALLGEKKLCPLHCSTTPFRDSFPVDKSTVDDLLDELETTSHTFSSGAQKINQFLKFKARQGWSAASTEFIRKYSLGYDTVGEENLFPVGDEIFNV